MPNWWGSIKAIIASVLALGGGLAVAVGGAWEKLSRSGEVGFWDAVYAAFTPVLPLVGSVAAILGFVATMAQLFGPKPATKDDVEDVAERHGDATRIRVTQEHENTRSHQSTETDRAIEAINRDKHEQAIADLQAGNASDELKARYLNALGIVRSDGSTVSPREAAEFALAANRAAQSDDPRIREVAELIDQGRIVEASDRKAAIAEESVQSAARELRDAASLALPVSPSKALEHFERATMLDPEHFWSWIELGQLRAAYDSLDSSELAFRNGLQRVVEERDRMVVHGAFGNLWMVRGQLKNAREEFEAALAINEQLAEKEPDNAEWQRDLSVSYNKLGDVEVDAGNLTAARDRFEAGLAIRERLAQKEPGNSQWQRDLAVNLERLGDMEAAVEPEPRLPDALKYFRRASDIRWEIARRNPDYRQFWAELAVPLMRRRMVRVRQDDEAALGNLVLELRELADHWQQQGFESDPRMEPVWAVLAAIDTGEGPEP